MIDFERCQETCVDHMLGTRHPSNRAVMIRSVDGCDRPAYLDRGYFCSSDGSFRCNSVSSICLNGRDAILADARQVIDAFLVEIRQGCEVDNTFVS